MGWRKIAECVGGFVDLSVALREQHPECPRDWFALDSPTGQTAAVTTARLDELARSLTSAPATFATHPPGEARKP
jgi:hypothetical protein